MSFLKWNENYSVHIPEIDNEHKQILYYINDLYDAHHAGKDHEALDTILDNLIDYTNTHFKHEEDLFEKFGYENANAHIEEHKALKQQIISFQKEFRENNVELTNEVFLFLQLWLANHIQESDKDYEPFLRDKLG